VNVNDLDLNLLRVFDAVLREKSVTAAAGGLGLTQPAVSNALSRLRALFDDPLFVRTPGGMDATPFARELGEPVRQALALLDSALAHGPGFDAQTSTRAFRFYMSDLGQIEFLPPLIERAQRVAPGVRLEAVALDVETSAPRWRRLDLRRLPPGPGPPMRRLQRFMTLRMPDARRPSRHQEDARAFARGLARWCPIAAAIASSRGLDRAGLSRRIAAVPHGPCADGPRAPISSLILPQRVARSRKKLVGRCRRSAIPPAASRRALQKGARPR
jgi:DNA-binding transcriptional LysR family regulator